MFFTLYLTISHHGKHGIVHPEILTPTMLKNTIQEFEEKRRTHFRFNEDESNYRHIIDISHLSVTIIGTLFSYILEIPIIEKEEGQIKRIIPIPHPVKNVYFSIIPDYYYVINYRDSNVPIDRETIEKYKNSRIQNLRTNTTQYEPIGQWNLRSYII